MCSMQHSSTTRQPKKKKTDKKAKRESMHSLMCVSAYYLFSAAVPILRRCEFDVVVGWVTMSRHRMYIAIDAQPHTAIFCCCSYTLPYRMAWKWVAFHVMFVSKLWNPVILLTEQAHAVSIFHTDFIHIHLSTRISFISSYLSCGWLADWLAIRSVKFFAYRCWLSVTYP